MVFLTPPPSFQELEDSDPLPERRQAKAAPKADGGEESAKAEEAPKPSEKYVRCFLVSTGENAPFQPLDGGGSFRALAS